MFPRRKKSILFDSPWERREEWIFGRKLVTLCRSCPHAGTLTVPGLLEAQREGKQPSHQKSTYLLHTPGSLGSPWPTETEYHCSHSEKITPWLGRWLRGPPKVTEGKTQTPSLPIYYLGRPARSLGSSQSESVLF